MAGPDTKYFASILAYQTVLLALLLIGCLVFNNLLAKLGFFALFVFVHSIITFAVFGHDKKKAEKSEWRTPEKVLHAITALFGLLGALIGMGYWNHKKQKSTFLCVFMFMALTSIVLYLVLAVIIFTLF